MANLPGLFQVQTIETRLAALKKEQEQARNSPPLAQTEAALGEMNSRLDEMEKKLQTIQSSNRKLDLELKSHQEHLAAEEKKLYGGSVTSSRELEQIQQKVAEYKNAITKLEDEILQLLEQEETLAEQKAELQKRRADHERVCKALQEETKRKSGELNIDIVGLEQELTEAAAQVPVEWLERYRKIAKAHHGIGIAQIKNSNCGACHVSLSEMLLQKAKRGDDVMIYCENCGRILFY